MRAIHRTFISAVVAVASLGGGAALAHDGVRHELRLSFRSDVDGTIADGAGRGTGLRDRLPGTGGALPENDPNLALDTTNRALQIASTDSDLNGPLMLDGGEYLGTNLARLGHSGTQDFEVEVAFRNIQYSEQFDQFGIYVGDRFSQVLRGGWLFSASGAQSFTVSNAQGADVLLQLGPGPSVGDDVTLTLSRKAGVYSYFLADLTNPSVSGFIPIGQPASFCGADLFVGVFAANARNANSKTLTLHSYRVTVTPGAGPFETFDAPGCVTSPAAINSLGEVAGWYQDATTVHGFVRGPDGTLTTIDAPGSTFTQPMALNSGGEVVGFFTDGTGTHGFVRGRNGGFAAVDPPGSLSTQATAIDRRGEITGTYTGALGLGHGFVRPAGGSFTIFDPPTSVSTQPAAINSRGEITGSYFDASSGFHGFVRSSDGTLTTIDVPGSFFTIPMDINPGGEVTGFYADSGFTLHGFVRDAGGNTTTIDPPGSVSTQPAGINPRGEITGAYLDAGFNSHGFVRAAGGTFVTLDPPGSVSTQPTGINARGEITGLYTDGQGGRHGFVLGRAPAADDEQSERE